MAQVKVNTAHERRADQTEETEAFNINALGRAQDQKKDVVSTAEAESAAAASQKSTMGLTQAIMPFVKEIKANAAKITSAKLSEIMGPIWDEFKEMSLAGKIFALAAVAALAAGVGYISWKLVAGNWDKIRNFVSSQLRKTADFVKPKTALQEEQNAVDTLTAAFENKTQDVALNRSDAEAILKYVFKAVGQGAMEGILTALAMKKGIN